MFNLPKSTNTKSKGNYDSDKDGNGSRYSKTNKRDAEDEGGDSQPRESSQLQRRRETNRRSKKRCRERKLDLISTLHEDLQRLSEEYEKLSKEKEQLQKELIDCLSEQQEGQQEATPEDDGRSGRSFDAVGMKLLRVAEAIASADTPSEHHYHTKKDSKSQDDIKTLSSEPLVSWRRAASLSFGTLPKLGDHNNLSSFRPVLHSNGVATVATGTTASALFASRLRQEQDTAGSPPSNCNIRLALTTANYSLLARAEAGAAYKYNNHGSSVSPQDNVMAANAALPPYARIGTSRQPYFSNASPSVATTAGPFDALLPLRRMICNGASSSPSFLQTLPSSSFTINDNNNLNLLSLHQLTSHHNTHTSSAWLAHDFMPPLMESTAATSAVSTTTSNSSNDMLNQVLQQQQQQQQQRNREQRKMLLSLLSDYSLLSDRK